MVFTFLLQDLFLFSTRAEAPSRSYVFPAGGKQGSVVEVTLGGKLDPWPLSVWTDCSNLVFRTNETKGKLTVEISTNASIGPHLIRFCNPDGASAPRCFVVGSLEEQTEKEPNDNPENAQVLDKLPVTINGRLDKMDDTDSFVVKLEQGQWLVASVDAYAIDSPVDPVLFLLDSTGTKVAFNHDGRSLDPLLTYQAGRAGTFVLQLAAFAYPPKAEVGFTGGESAVYRLTISRGPMARFAFPLAVQRRRKTPVHILGWNLGTTGQGISREIDTTGLDQRADDIVVVLPGVENSLRLPVTDLPEQIEVEPNNTIDLAQPVSIPCAIHGRIDPSGDEDRFVFKARKGDPFRFQVDSASFGFPLDAVVKIEDATGQELARSDDHGRSPDPELHWSAQSEGAYIVAIGDLIQRGGSDYVYRLEMSHPQPNFKAVVGDHAFRLEAGKTTEVKVNVSRLNGFSSNILVAVDGLPEGISATIANVPAKGGEVTLKLSAPESAPSINQPVRVLAIAPDLDAPRVQVAIANLKGQNAAAGDLLINQTDKLWLTVIAKRTTDSKKEESADPKAK